MKVKARLEAIAKWIPEKTIVADIGTDHAYLPVMLVQRGIIKMAIAGDIASGPCQAARKTIEAAGLLDNIKVRQGNGLSVVTISDEVEVIIIAGMGAGTMIDIITEGKEIMEGVKRLVLQPMNGAAKLRQWAGQQGWQIVAEDLVEETGLLYEIIVLERGKTEAYSAAMCEIGPKLWREGHPLLREHFARIIIGYHKLLAGMRLSENAKNSEKYQELSNLVEALEVARDDFESR